MPQKNVNQEIQSRIEAFVEEIGQLIREAALSAVGNALGGTAAPARRAKKVSRKRSSRKTGKRVRRSTEAVEALGKTVLAAIKSHPGRRLGEIAAQVGAATKDVRRPAVLLLKAGAVRTEGQRGGTRYFPAKRSGAARSRKRAAKKTGRKVSRKASRKRKSSRRT